MLTALVSTSLFFIPAIIIASCYTVIVVTIWKKGQTMQAPKVTQSLLPRGKIVVDVFLEDHHTVCQTHRVIGPFRILSSL